MIDAAVIERLAVDLRHAERSATPVDLITDWHPDFGWDDARAVARATDRLRVGEGDTMIGYKLGWTSAAMSSRRTRRGRRMERRGSNPVP